MARTSPSPSPSPRCDGVFGEAQPWLKFVPEEASVYEWVFDLGSSKWKLWTDTIAKVTLTLTLTLTLRVAPSGPT